MTAMHQRTLATLRATLAAADTQGCWPWQGKRTNGYGIVEVDHIYRQAHRVVYEFLVGPIPDGLFIDHLCRNRACVNPNHLEPVTNRENLLRGETPLVNRELCISERHVLAEVGWFVDSQGFRRCRECRKESQRRWALANAR